MNQIKLSLRAADDPRSIKEEAGLPTFASVFSLHNSTSQTRSEVIPVTVKAFNELAIAAVAELKKGGVAFVVEGRFAYYKNPDPHPEVYSIVADRFSDITPPKSSPVKPA